MPDGRQGAAIGQRAAKRNPIVSFFDHGDDASVTAIVTTQMSAEAATMPTSAGVEIVVVAGVVVHRVRRIAGAVSVALMVAEIKVSEARVSSTRTVGRKCVKSTHSIIL